MAKRITKSEMLRIVQSQLAIDLNCTPDDLNGEKDSIIFTAARENVSRRPFPRNKRHFDMLSMGKAIVVSATPEILGIVKPLLGGKTRDEAFSMPFVNGHILYYLPDLAQINLLASPSGFTYELVEQGDIPALYQNEGFRNALQYDSNHPRPDVLATLARKDGRIVGMAGASKDCAKMWQIGIDALPEYRNYGLAAYLVNWLALEILDRGYVPYYGTASSNIASQRVAHRAGFRPAWVCAYKGRFDGLGGPDGPDGLECSSTS
jgi:GNAT superfamily N-acetyltransferase